MVRLKGSRGVLLAKVQLLPIPFNPIKNTRFQVGVQADVFPIPKGPIKASSLLVVFVNVFFFLFRLVQLKIWSSSARCPPGLAYLATGN